MLRFESPEILWFLILPFIIAITCLLLKISNYSKKIVLLQMLISSILILALASPIKENLKKTGNAAVIIDISNSMDAVESEKLFQSAKAITNELTNVAVIPFAEKSENLGSFSQVSYQSVISAASKISRERSNLESAVELASNQYANLILISDGYQNLGNVLASKQTSRIFPLVPNQTSNTKKSTLEISALELPLTASAKRSVEIKTAVSNSTSETQSGRLSIFHDNKLVRSEEITINPKQEKLINAESDPNQEGIREIKAIFEPENKAFPISKKIAYLSSEKREKILLLNGSDEDARLLRQAFDGQSYELIENNTNSQTALNDYSAVILNNIAANQLPAGFPSQLSEYVRQGGGFIMIGGNRSYGLGGYVGTTIAELLPVEPIPPQAQQKRLTVAVELIIDKSRSMADSSKLDFSKEAAREVVRNLKDEDWIGVIGFDASPFEVVRLGRVGEIKAQALERIGRLFPAQKTNLFPAMDEGRRRLEAVEAGRKHMIILTDGKIPDADQSYLELVKQMRVEGITLSTVLVGNDYDFGFLRDMAERGGGAYYQTSDPSSLPRIFLQDVRTRSGEKTMQEQSEFPVLIGPSGIKSTSINNFPDLLGLVETKPKERASLELITRSSDKTLPVLASWKLDQGKVSAFTSDANGRWSRAWGTWSKFVPFWTELLDSVRQKTDESPIRFDLRKQVQGDSIKLDLSVFEDPKTDRIQATLTTPDGKELPITFEQIAKGNYQAQVSNKIIAGKYELKAKIAKRSLTPVAFMIEEQIFKEETGLGFNRQLLEELANLSSGKINPSQEDLMEAKLVSRGSTSYRLYLLILALIIYLLGIITRELRFRIKIFNLKSRFQT